MAFSSGFLSPPSLRCLSPTNLTVSILIPPDLYGSHPGSFARCLGQKQNEIWIWAGNNLRWSFLWREFQLFCSLGTANRLNGLSVRALPPSLPPSLCPAYGDCGITYSVMWEEGDAGQVNEQKCARYSHVCTHVCTHEHTAHKHKLAHKHGHAPTLVHWAPEGFVCEAEKCHVSRQHTEV